MELDEVIKRLKALSAIMQSMSIGSTEASHTRYNDFALDFLSDQLYLCVDVLEEIKRK